jgi:site-specific DNA recombinase
MRKPLRDTAPRKIRCAIYTRKSTEEGLEQEFNSLDAQREACAAYIVSQRHEGWIALPIPMTMAATQAATWTGPG